MMRDYWSEKEQCPFYEQIKDRRRRMYQVCNHPSPNIGEKRSTNVIEAKDKKECTHGNYKTPSSEYKCRIITIFLKKKSVQIQTTLTEFEE